MFPSVDLELHLQCALANGYLQRRTRARRVCLECCRVPAAGKYYRSPSNTED